MFRCWFAFWPQYSINSFFCENSVELNMPSRKKTKKSNDSLVSKWISDDFGSYSLVFEPTKSTKSFEDRNNNQVIQCQTITSFCTICLISIWYEKNISNYNFTFDCQHNYNLRQIFGYISNFVDWYVDSYSILFHLQSLLRIFKFFFISNWNFTRVV